MYGSELVPASVVSSIESLLSLLTVAAELDGALTIVGPCDIVEFFAICRSTIDFDGFVWGSKPVATTDTLALPSNFSSKIEPTITSASGCTCSLISLVILSTSWRVKSVPPVMLIKRPFAPSRE